jgi:alcohol dehydrogenase class IV
MRIIAEQLPKVIENPEWIDGRVAMAWIDALAGLCIASTGFTLPYGIGMTNNGHCPNVMHVESQAVTYPEFTRFTYSYAVSQFAEMGRIFNPSLNNLSSDDAAANSCEALDSFLKKIGLRL